MDIAASNAKNKVKEVICVNTNIINSRYAEMVKKASPGTKTIPACIGAFVVGGLICTLGEWLANIYMTNGMQKPAAYTAVSITLIFIAAVLTGLDLYPRIARIGGAGTLVPITGFANAIASPAIEFKSEGYILGLGAKLFGIAGPVLVYGYSAGILYGLVVYIFRL